LPRRCRFLPLIATACLVVVGAWIWFGADMRASVAIHADGDFTAPDLWIGGRPIVVETQSHGPWRFYAWANLRVHRVETEIVVAWTGADGQRRTLRDTMHQGPPYHGSVPHCAYLIRLDQSGNPVPLRAGRPADRIGRFCHG
jgi:hypothetical protein